ncbi:hypothetical protein Cgig2_029342 [Carnegiea gigantea]|uniref:DOC domain-containing protein n=1 Tax=Carnegiea gigantea TaxID=171969 RepID=A0A9Q1KVS1_9CARY|nr:hypothetical protein Cgig2_029342 [Carnegiea gigantea]
MNSGSARKRPGAPLHPSPAQQKHHAFMEEEEMDEDVFLEATLIDEDVQILRDIEERQALASRLAKWARPALFSAPLHQTQSIVFQQLEIDYVIGESHKELLPNRSGPAAVFEFLGSLVKGIVVGCRRVAVGCDGGLVAGGGAQPGPPAATVIAVARLLSEGPYVQGPVSVKFERKLKGPFLMATESSEGEDEGKMVGGSKHLVVDDDMKEMTKNAAWSVSSCKPGNGVQCLRDDNCDTYWQLLLSLEIKAVELVKPAGWVSISLSGNDSR